MAKKTDTADALDQAPDVAADQAAEATRKHPLYYCGPFDVVVVRDPITGATEKVRRGEAAPESIDPASLPGDWLAEPRRS